MFNNRAAFPFVLLALGAISVFIANIGLQLYVNDGRLQPMTQSAQRSSAQQRAVPFRAHDDTGRHMPRVCIAGTAPSRNIAFRVAREWPVWSFWSVTGEEQAEDVRAEAEGQHFSCMLLVLA
jgi:hypothetical protein